MEAPPLIPLGKIPAGAGVSIVAPASFARQERDRRRGEGAARAGV